MGKSQMNTNDAVDSAAAMVLTFGTVVLGLISLAALLLGGVWIIDQIGSRLWLKLTLAYDLETLRRHMQELKRAGKLKTKAMGEPRDE